MKRFLPTGIAGCGLLAAALIALAGSAYAYFSSEGEGTASAAVWKLGSPTINTATPAAGGTVTLGWSATPAPDGGTVTYYVTRDGGVAAGTCPVSTAPTAVTSCIDKEVPIGEHSYTVTAIWRDWTVTSAVKKATVSIGAVAKFVVGTNGTTTMTAGGSANLTITAKDVNNNTVSTYTGSKNLIFSGANAIGTNKPTVSNASGTATAFGTTTAITFASGAANISSTKNGVLRLYQAGTAEVIATEGSITTPAPPTITVSPAATNKFVLAAASATPAVGAADNLTITAQDTYGNTTPAYTGSKNLVFSGAVAPPTGNLPTVTDSSGADIPFGTATAILFDAGVASAAEGDGGAMELYKSGSTAVKATEGTILTPTAVTVTVAPGAATKLVLAAATATPTAATGFNLTTTAQDVYGDTATAGSKNIVFSGATASPSGALPTVVNAAGTAVNFGTATALTFTAGVAAVSSSKNGFAKLNKVEVANVSASDGTFTTPTVTLTVATGAASRVAFNEPVISAGSKSAICLFTCTITGLGNSGTFKAKLAITDSVGNIVNDLAAKTVTVSASGTAGSAIAGSPLTTAAAGPAITATEFTYTAPVSGAYSNTITAASTGYTSASATAAK
jgi:hypothetical protein